MFEDDRTWKHSITKSHNSVLKGKHFVLRIFIHNYSSKNLHVPKSLHNIFEMADGILANDMSMESSWLCLFSGVIGFF